MPEKFTFFWRSHSPFSQWYIVSFIHKGIKFNCAEQAMMWEKAMLFGDTEMAEKILKETEPRKQKELGRQVRGFDQKIWDRSCKNIVKSVNRAKFTQNKHILKALLATAGTTLVEASPYDRIWGIGLEENDPRAHDRKTWLGTNFLGEMLTRLCNELLEELDETNFEWVRGLNHGDLVDMIGDIVNCQSIEEVRGVFKAWRPQ